LRKILCNKEQGKNETVSTEPQDYFTDEEDLSTETDWVLKKGKRSTKKRKAEDSPEAIQLNADAANKYDGQKRVQIKEKQPPPINVTGITDYATIQSLMNSIVAKEYRIIALNNNVWKINTQDSDTYRALAKKLNNEAVQCYTYEDKNNRSIKVMARGLHATCTKEKIMKELQQNGLKILDAVTLSRKKGREMNREIKL